MPPPEQHPQQIQQPVALAPQHQQHPPTFFPEKQAQFQQFLQSIPPERFQQYQQTLSAPPHQQQSPQPPLNTAFSAPPTQPTTPSLHAKPPKDERKTGKVQRFLGDTLVGRFARASVQTASSALKMPAALSPWGDNNPVTLPNVRYRDAVLFTTFAFVGAPLVEGADSVVTDLFGADSFVAELVSSGAGAVAGSVALKYGVFQLVEQAIDKGALEHLLPEEEKMLRTTSVKSLQVGIKHKLMGVDADLRFWGVYPAKNAQECAKGWFCPYLFASARTPLVPRANDFAIAQFYGPFVGGMPPLSTPSYTLSSLLFFDDSKTSFNLTPHL